MKSKYCFIIGVDADTHKTRIARTTRTDARQIGSKIYESREEAQVAIDSGETGAICDTE